MRKFIFVVLFGLLGSNCLPAQQMNPSSDITKYVLTFYAISDTVAAPVFVPGDTITIEWIQPMRRTTYEDQPDPVFGNHTGAKYSIEIPNDLVNYKSDSLATARQVVILPESNYEITIRAVDTRGNSSKESDPFRFALVSGAPAVPVSVKILIRRNGH